MTGLRLSTDNWTYRPVKTGWAVMPAADGGHIVYTADCVGQVPRFAGTLAQCLRFIEKKLTPPKSKGSR